MPIENDNNDELDQDQGHQEGQGEQSQQSGPAVDGAQNTDQGAAPGKTPDGQKPEGEAGKEGEQGGDKDKPKSALDAVLKVVGDRRQAAEQEADGGEKKPAAAGKDGEKKGADGDEGDGKEDLTVGKIEKDEWDKLPQRTRQRITQFRAKLKDRDTQIQAMTPKVQTYDQLVGYCRNNGLSPDDFTEGLEIMRLVKQDPAAAYERLKPVLALLQEHVGELLPDDLKAELEEGKITEARAKELARARKERERLEHQGKQRNAADEERRRQEDSQRFVQNVERSVREWEGRWKSSDPDYKRKAPMVWERMQVLLANEKEITPQRAVEIADQAKSDVEERLKEFTPTKKRIDPVPPGGSGKVTQQPKSALEAARLAVQRAA